MIVGFGPSSLPHRVMEGILASDSETNQVSTSRQSWSEFDLVYRSDESTEIQLPKIVSAPKEF